MSHDAHSSWPLQRHVGLIWTIASCWRNHNQDFSPELRYKANHRIYQPHVPSYNSIRNLTINTRQTTTPSFVNLIKKSRKRSSQIPHTWLSRFGSAVTSRHPLAQSVSAVTCRFCLNFGCKKRDVCPLQKFYRYRSRPTPFSNTWDCHIHRNGQDSRKKTPNHIVTLSLMRKCPTPKRSSLNLGRRTLDLLQLSPRKQWTSSNLFKLTSTPINICFLSSDVKM